MSYKSSHANFEGTDNRSTSERTPLLDVHVNTYLPGISQEHTTSRNGEWVGVPHEGELFPTLRKVISNVPLAIEPQSIAALGGHPEGEDLGLKADDGSKIRDVAECIDQGGEIGFHGGISRRKFWVIFAGLLNLLLILLAPY